MPRWPLGRQFFQFAEKLVVFDFHDVELTCGKGRLAILHKGNSRFHRLASMCRDLPPVCSIQKQLCSSLRCCRSSWIPPRAICSCPTCCSVRWSRSLASFAIFRSRAGRHDCAQPNVVAAALRNQPFTTPPWTSTTRAVAWGIHCSQCMKFPGREKE
jgi:hypothetical protein